MLALALLPVLFTAWTPGMLPLRHGRLSAPPRACVLARAVVVAAPGEDWNATNSTNSPSQQLNWEALQQIDGFSELDLSVTLSAKRIHGSIFNDFFGDIFDD